MNSALRSKAAGFDLVDGNLQLSYSSIKFVAHLLHVNLQA